MATASMAGVGSYVPEHIVENAELEKRLGLESGWIEDKTGVRQRHMAADEEGPGHMAASAARAALDDAGMAPGDLDGILVATTVPDTFCPSTAARVQAALDAGGTFAFDVNTGSAGFIAALAAARAFIAAGDANTILVAAAETATRFVNWDDYKTCILFGDGAGAVVLRAGEERPLLGVRLGCDGAAGEALVIPGGGAIKPPSAEVADRQLATLHMKGGDVFRFAKAVMGEAIKDALEHCGVPMDKVDLIVPHQSNRRIIEEAARVIGLPIEKFFMNLDEVGNTSAASVPVALAAAQARGLLRPGGHVVLVSYGAGLAWGAAVVRW